MQENIINIPLLYNEDCMTAMEKLNRNFIGIEKDKNYFSIAQKRLV